MRTKKIISLILAGMLCVGMLPTAAFAQSEGPIEEPVPRICACENACADDAMNVACVVCGVENATAESCGKFVAPAEPTVSENYISGWMWDDEDGFVTGTGIGIPGLNETDFPDWGWEMLVSMILPPTITATIGESVETVALQWSSADFIPDENGSYPYTGNYTLTAALPEGYALSEGAAPLTLTLELGGGTPLATPEPGLDAATNTYYIVGQDGYPTRRNPGPISLPEGVTLDLTYAESFDAKEYYTNNIYLFSAQGDVTVIGSPNPLSFGEKLLVAYKTGATVTLNNLNWTETVAVINPFTETATIIYEGVCNLPEFRSMRSIDEAVVFRPKDSASVLNMPIYDVYDYEEGGTLTSKVTFQGGTVNMTKGIAAYGVWIEDCTLTIAGDKAFGINVEADNSNLTIKESSVNITAGAGLTTQDSRSYALGSRKSRDASRYWHQECNEGTITTKLVIDNSTVTVDTGATLIVSPIGGMANIEIKNGSVVTATASSALVDTSTGGMRCYYSTAIGGLFRSILIDSSTVTAHAGYAAGLGSSYVWYNLTETAPTSSITIKDSTVYATSVNSAAIGSTTVGETTERKTQNVAVTISGDSHVVARSVNGAGIGGGMRRESIKDPDAVEINPGIGGWENGGSGGVETASLRMRRSAGAVADSTIPANLSNYILSEGQTLTVNSTDSGTPVILAESGVCAISSETVTTNVTILQNTVQIAPAQTMPVKVGGVLLADLHKSYKSVARTAGAGTVTDGSTVTFDTIAPGTQGMTYGSGSDPDPLVNWNSAVSPLYGDTFAIAENAFNRFWATPQQLLGGSVVVATGSVSGPAVTEVVRDTALYANISGLTPTTARTSGMLSYQWYKNGTAISGATTETCTPTEVGLYHYVVTGAQLYRGAITSGMVTVKNTATETVPTPPELDVATRDSITLKAPTDGKTYEYSIDGGQNWQTDLLLDNLIPQTTYNVVRRETVAGGTNTNPISAPLTVTTLNNQPVAADILALLDYEKESLRSLPTDIAFYSDADCTVPLTALNTDDSLTPFIAAHGTPRQYIYARFVGVTGTGNDKVTAVEIPDRPITPTLADSNLSSEVTSITVTGTKGVEYTCNNVTQTYADSPLLFDSLRAETGYTVTAMLPGSNINQHFCSAKVSLAIATKPIGKLTTTILIPVGTTTAVSFDLSDVVVAAGNGYVMPTALTSGNTAVISDVVVAGNTVTLTPTDGRWGNTTITGTNTTITVKLVETVGRQDNGRILWLWESASADADTTRKFTDAAMANLPTEHTMHQGALRQLTPVYAYGVKVETLVTEPVSTALTLPYWDAGDSGKPYLLLYEDPTTGVISPVPAITSGANGVMVTRTQTQQGVYGLYSLIPNSYTVTLDPNGGSIAAGKEITRYDYGFGASLPTAGDMTLAGYTFAGWYDNSGLTGNVITAISVTDSGNKVYFAKWLSADAQVTDASVSGVTGQISGTTISVELPIGSTIPETDSEVSITLAVGATRSNLQTADRGKTWTFTVTAADGTTKLDYTIRVTVTQPPQYSVSVQTEGNGTATATPATAASGTKIALAATPNSDSHLKEWGVVSGGVTISSSEFTMPGNDVVVKAVFEIHRDDNGDGLCDGCGHLMNRISRIEQTAITEVPDSLKTTEFNTVEKIATELSRVLTSSTGYPAENIATCDITLQYSTDGGITWIDATEADFPVYGITVVLPYPTGTGKDTHDFMVTHMFTVTSTKLGTTAGQTEQPTVTKVDEGIRVTLKGLSPVGIAWKAVGSTDADADNRGNPEVGAELPQTGDNSNMGLWLGLLALSAAGLAGAVVVTRKRRSAR